jgi:maleate isomerase
MFRVTEDGAHRKIGVVIPSTNWVVEAELETLPLEGLSFHFGRMHILDARMDTNERFEAMMQRFRDTIGETIDSVVTMRPEYMLMGMSSETFWGGKEGAQHFVEEMEARAQLPVTTGAISVQEALNLYGATRLAVVTPYQPVGDEQVERFLSDCGYEVVRLAGLRCESAHAIAQLTEERVRPVLEELDGDEVDAIVQVGTNFSMIRLADQMERELGKPVIAINAANIWHALRHAGIDAQFDGFGSLLREH